MMEVTVKIPDGEYCSGCKFLNQYCHKLVDMTGNETGNTREGWRCELHNEELEQAEESKCCFTFLTAKKCFQCKATDEERASMAAMLFLLFNMLGKESKQPEE
jgi:hypothetical protein